MHSVIKFLLIVVVASLSVNVGCKKKDENKNGSTAYASLSMANGTSLRLGETEDCPSGADECWTPTSYGLKILNVYVSPDEEGAKTAPAGLIWNNPDCKTLTGTSTVDDLDYDYDYMDDCIDSDVDDYFELVRSSDAVNKDLNSQNYSILPGTYNYVAMTFCIGGAKSKNGQFQAEGMDEPYQVESGVCGVTSVKADPPIIVSGGDAITVELTYDLTNIIGRYGNNNADDCYISSDESVVRCFGYPNSLIPDFADQ